MRDEAAATLRASEESEIDHLKDVRRLLLFYCLCSVLLYDAGVAVRSRCRFVCVCRACPSSSKTHRTPSSRRCWSRLSGNWARVVRAIEVVMLFCLLSHLSCAYDSFLRALQPMARASSRC